MYEQRKTSSGLPPICKGILAQSFSCKKLNNQKHGEYSLQYKKNNFILNAGKDERISIYETYFVFVPLFSKPILTRQSNYYLGKTLKSFQPRRFPFGRETKPTSQVTLTVHFSAALKALVLGNLFKVFRLDITFAREAYYLGIKMKKI